MKKAREHMRTAARLRWPATLAAGLATLALAGAACGGSPAKPNTSASSSTPSSAAASASGTPAKIPQVAALVPKSLRSKGSITMAMDATYPPDEFIASNGHTIIGMDADLGKALAAVMGLKAKEVNASFDTIIPGLSSGKYDIGLSSFTDTKAREKVVNFVDYFQAGEGFYVKSSSKTTFNGLSSLCGHKVAVESGTTEQSDATKQNTICKKDGKPGVDVETYENQSEANLAVSSGRADVGFADSQVAAYIVKQSHGTFKLTGTAFKVAPYGIAVPKGPLDKAILAALDALKREGIYTKILDKWGVQSGALKSFRINGAVS